MFPKLAEDLARMPQLLDETRKVAERVLTGLDERPVTAANPHVESRPLTESGEGLRAALTEFEQRWEPGFSASAGPRYLGFVTGGTTPAALAGDWLTSALDQNAHGRTGSAAADLEHETVGWLASMFGLTPEFSGAFVTGATMSNLVGLAVAREWLGERKGVSVSKEGVGALGEVRVLSGAAHSSVGKALSVLGIGRQTLVEVPTLPGREAVDVKALDTALAGAPAIVVANAGTVNTVDFDHLAAIVELKQRHDFWLHVDAAFGGFAALAPEFAHLVDGIDGADSVCVDLHKWLNVPYDSAVQFTRRRDLQVRVFENVSPYLGTPGDDPDFAHLTPETSRRLRALAAWFSLAAYGRAGHREIVTRNVDLAREFGQRLAKDGRWRVFEPVRLNVVCFAPTDRAVGDVLTQVADSGEAFLTPTVYQGVPAIRAAFSNWRTVRADLERLCTVLAV